MRKAGQPFGGLGDSAAVEQGNGLLSGLLPLQALVEQQRLHELIADAVHRVERGHGFLKDHGDAVAPDAPQPGLLCRKQVFPLEEHLTFAGGDILFKQAQDGEGGHRFAGARFAHQGHGLAVIDTQGNPVENGGIALIRIKAGGKFPYLKQHAGFLFSG